MTPLLTTTEAAQQLGIQPQSVRKLVARGRLAAQKFGASLMFTHRDVERAKGRPATRDGPATETELAQPRASRQEETETETERARR